MNAWMPRRWRVGRAVQQDRMVLDDLFEDVPDLGPDALDDALGALDVVGEALLDELAHDERLEQLEGHLLGQAALVELELRADDDDRAARVVDPLAEQVLAEPALLALEHVGQALEPVVAGPGDRPAATAVVDQRVARLLEHPLLVADDDLGRAELEEPLEPVVPVDHAAVQVVQVGRREPATVELDHRAEVRRDHRQDRQDHPVGPRPGPAERLDQAEPLDRLLAPLAGRRPDLDVEGPRELLEVHPLDDVADRLGAHPGVEDPAAARAPLPYLASRSRKFQPSSEVSGRVISGWSFSISSRARLDLVLQPVGIAGGAARARPRARRRSAARRRRSAGRSPPPRRPRAA